MQVAFFCLYDFTDFLRISPTLLNDFNDWINFSKTRNYLLIVNFISYDKRQINKIMMVVRFDYYT